MFELFLWFLWYKMVKGKHISHFYVYPYCKPSRLQILFWLSNIFAIMLIVFCFFVYYYATIQISVICYNVLNQSYIYYIDVHIIVINEIQGVHSISINMRILFIYCFHDKNKKSLLFANLVGKIHFNLF